MEGRSQKVNGQSTVMESPTLITHTHLHRWWMTMSHAASFLLLSYLQTNNSLTRVCNHWLGINWSRQTLGYGIYVTMMFIIQVWTTPWLLNLQLVHVFTWLKPVTVEPILKTPLADNQDNCSIDRVQHYVLFSPEKKLIYLSCTSQVLIVRPLYMYTRKTGCWSMLWFWGCYMALLQITWEDEISLFNCSLQVCLVQSECVQYVQCSHDSTPQ